MSNIETNNEETELLSLRIKKLAESQTVIATGKEYEGLYELTNKSAEKYLRSNIRGSYLNVDTGDLIKVTRKGAEKVTRHDAENLAHLKSLALIPELIRKSIFIAEDLNEKNKNEYDTFRYYVVGLKMEGIDYTVKLAIGVKNGCTYISIITLIQSVFFETTTIQPLFSLHIVFTPLKFGFQTSVLILAHFISSHKSFLGNLSI